MLKYGLLEKAFFLAIASLPFGPAAQNIACSLLLVTLFFGILPSRRGQTVYFRLAEERKIIQSGAAFTAFLLWLGLSYSLFTTSLTLAYFKNLAGYLPVVLGPLFFYLCLKKMPQKTS